MLVFLVLPVITILAIVLAWRTRGTERWLSIAILVATLIFIAWYFSQLFALEL